MPSPFGFDIGTPAGMTSRKPRQVAPEPVPFGFPAPRSKMAQTADILAPYVTGPFDAFKALMNSPFALGFDPTEQDAANGLAAGGGAMMAGSVVPKPRNALNMGIRAFHGSPHDFDEFSMSKIGTGEGAQAYGHGLYFAEKEGVARSYRDALCGKLYKFNADPADIAAKYGEGTLDAFYKYEGDPKEIGGVISGLRQAVQRDLAEFGVSDVSQLKPMYDGDLASATIRMSESADKLEALVKSGDIMLDPGKMYEVDIDADPNAFLDWDNGGEKLYRDTVAQLDGNRDALKQKYGDEALFAKPTELARRELVEKGIPGIKYLDAGSRTQIQNDDLLNLGRDLDRRIANAERDIKALPDSARAEYQSAIDSMKQERRALQKKIEPTRNYVVFDDKLISIVKKYGIAGASAMLGYNILDGLDEAQAAELKSIEGK